MTNFNKKKESKLTKKTHSKHHLRRKEAHKLMPQIEKQNLK